MEYLTIRKDLRWKVNEKLDTELREFKNYIFQSLLETCNQDLKHPFCIVIGLNVFKYFLSSLSSWSQNEHH